MKKKNGFTLIELLSTLIILGIVVTIAIQSYNVLIVKNDDLKYNYYWNFVEKASDLYFDARKVNMIPGECLSVNYQALVDKNYLKEEGVTCTGNIILRKESKKYVYDDTNIECKSNDKIVKEKGAVEAVCPVTQVFTFDDNYERLNDIATTMTASIDKWENVSTTHTVKKGYNLASSKRISFTECSGECGIYQNLTSRLIKDKAYSFSVLLKANSGKTLKVGVGTTGIQQIETTGEWQKVSGDFIANSTDASKFSILSTSGWQEGEELYINSVIVYEKSLSLKNKLAFEIDVPFGESLPIPRREGYQFTGWFTEKDGGTKIEKTTTVPKIKNIIYYAHWTNKNTKVNYLANGGKGTMTSDNVTYGNEYTIKNNTFTKTGYTFNYWKDNDNNKNFSIWQQAPITWIYDKDINLSAIWKANKYTVTFKPNGGETPSKRTMDVTYDSQYGTLATVSRTGYTFKGWYTSASGGTKITETTKVVTASNHDLYAQWTANKYTVAYKGNGNTGGSTTSSTHTYDIEKTLTANGFTKTGYTFSKWNKNADGSSRSYTNKQSVINLTSTNNATINLHAIWTANTYNIGYTMNGGTKGTNAPTTATYDKSVTISNPTKTVKVTGNKNGTGATVGTATSKAQTFAGWTSTTINTSTAYYGSTKWSNTSTKVKSTSFKNLTPTKGGTVTLVANWTPVAFNLPTVSKKGHTCKWNTEPDGSGTTYKSKASYTPKANSKASIDMYARCAANKYTVTFDANGGSTPSPKTKEVTYGNTYGTLPSTSKSGKNFKGWYTSGGTKITKDSKVTITKNTTLTAKWEDKEYNMGQSFNYDGSGYKEVPDGAGRGGFSTYKAKLTVKSSDGGNDFKTKVYLNGTKIIECSGTCDETETGSMPGGDDTVRDLYSVTTGGDPCYVVWDVYFYE